MNCRELREDHGKLKNIIGIQDKLIGELGEIKRIQEVMNENLLDQVGLHKAINEEQAQLLKRFSTALKAVALMCETEDVSEEDLAKTLSNVERLVKGALS